MCEVKLNIVSVLHIYYLPSVPIWGRGIFIIYLRYHYGGKGWCVNSVVVIGVHTNLLPPKIVFKENKKSLQPKGKLQMRPVATVSI